MFFFVVGEGVLTVAVGMVAAAILVAVVAHGRGKGEVRVDQGFGIEEGVIVAGLDGVGNYKY